MLAALLLLLTRVCACCENRFGSAAAPRLAQTLLSREASGVKCGGPSLPRRAAGFLRSRNLPAEQSERGESSAALIPHVSGALPSVAGAAGVAEVIGRVAARGG